MEKLPRCKPDSTETRFTRKKTLMESRTIWMLGGGAVLAAGAYYWFVMRPKALAAAAAPALPIPNQNNAATYQPPPQMPPPQTPVARTAAQIAQAIAASTQQSQSVSQRGAVKQGTYEPGGGNPPMPTGIHGADGYFYSWSPAGGAMITDPITGTWIANQSNQAITIYGGSVRPHPGAADGRPSNKVVLPPNYLYSLNTGEIRT